MAKLHLTVLNSRQNQEGKFPIFIAVSEKREVRYIKTDYAIDNLYEFDHGMVVCRKDAKITNQRLQFVLSQYQLRLDAISDHRIYKCSQIVEILKGEEKRNQFITIKEFFELKIAELRKEGRGSYADMNVYTLGKILSILGDISLQSFSPETIRKFIRGIDELSNATKQMRLTHLKARLNEAIEQGLVKYEIHPFTKIQIPKSAIRELDITIDEFIRIRKFVAKHKTLVLAQDLFLLSFYLGGMNLIDIVNADFSGKEIKFVRAKTKHNDQEEKMISFSIPEEARFIIKKYMKRNGTLDFGYKYTYKNFQRYTNFCFKKLAYEVNIKTDFSFYSARKTFSQFASEIGIPDNIIDCCLGHSDKSRGIIRYYTTVKQKKVEMAIKRVIDYTNNPENYQDYIELRSDIMMMRIL